MTTREKFKKAVIEAIHGLPYEEAITNEEYDGCVAHTKGEYCLCHLEESNTNKKFRPFPITIGRVMQALSKKAKEKCLSSAEISRGAVWTKNYDDVLKWLCKPKNMGNPYGWKLTKENGIECTDDDQSDETIEKLLELISNK